MPENSGYMIAAYIVSAVVFGGYVLSLISRSRAMTERSEAMDTVTRP